MIISGDKDEKLDRRRTLDWLIHSQHGRSCVDEGIFVNGSFLPLMPSHWFFGFLFVLFTPFSGSFLDIVAQKIVGFLYGDLQALVQKAILQNTERFVTEHPSSAFLFCKSFKLNFLDFEKSMKHFDDIMAKTIGAPKIPGVNFINIL